jgi:ketosteroid isomerase-like protein
MTFSEAPTDDEAWLFARRWIAAWNSGDLEAVLQDYADDVVLRSPRAAVVVPESGGIVRGKEALRSYWT